MPQRSAVPSDGKLTQGQDLTAHLVATLRYHNQVLSMRRVEDRASIYELEQDNARMRQRLEALDRRASEGLTRTPGVARRARKPVKGQWGETQ